MYEAKILELAREFAQKANECCHRSDGWEESLAADISAELLAFARLMAAAEREACAAIAETAVPTMLGMNPDVGPMTNTHYVPMLAATKWAAQAIRSRTE